MDMYVTAGERVGRALSHLQDSGDSVAAAFLLLEHDEKFRDEIDNVCREVTALAETLKRLEGNLERAIYLERMHPSEDA